MVIAMTSGTGAFPLTDRVGVVRPAHCTALGKVLLAALSAQQLERFIQGQELRSYTPKTITEPDLLRQDIEEVARTGVAFDDGEFSPEVRCVAVAVHGFTAQIVGALGISGPVRRLSIQVLQKKTELVKEAARRLSRDLAIAARWPPTPPAWSQRACRPRPAADRERSGQSGTAPRSRDFSGLKPILVSQFTMWQAIAGAREIEQQAATRTAPRSGPQAPRAASSAPPRCDAGPG